MPRAPAASGSGICVPGRPDPAKSHKAPVAGPAGIYRNRHRVERFRARLKEGRAIATRHGKTANSFLGVLGLKATLDWTNR